MKNFFSIVVLILFFLISVDSSAVSEEINDIYTEARGNNPYEAKIKAIDRATYRAFVLLADKLLIDDSSLQKATREELKNIFTNIIIRNEDMKIYPSGASYSATLQFTFKQSKVNELITKYCSEATKKKFFKAVVIPVFKINSVLFVDKDKKGWAVGWKRWRVDLSDNRIYLPDEIIGLDKKISARTLMQKTYDDFIEFIPFKLFEKVVITTSEFFTNRNNGDSYLRIKDYIISPEGTKEESRDYPISSDRLAMNKIVNEVVYDFIRKYGAKKEEKTFGNDIILDSLSSALIAEEVKKDNFYSFVMEVDYQDEVEEIQAKLNKIKQITKYVLESHYENGYKLKVYTSLDMMDLSEQLYYNGLSFYYNQYKTPVLINIQNPNYLLYE